MRFLPREQGMGEWPQIWHHNCFLPQAGLLLFPFGHGLLLHLPTLKDTTEQVLTPRRVRHHGTLLGPGTVTKMPDYWS